MRISLQWLRDYIDLEFSVDELCEKMTMLGLEIESVEEMGEGIENVVVGQITAIEAHPDADKLVVCTTEVGGEAPLQIVCGAKNMKVGDKVPTAVIGATLPGGFKIGKRKMRGVASQGMMCSTRELGLGEDHDGLMILEADLTVGDDIRAAIGLNDTVLEIEVTPNRNDWSSMIGTARELAAALGTSFRTPQFSIEEGNTSVNDLASVTLEAPDLCPRYTARVLTNITVGPSPLWLAQRLIAAGQRPINNVVDATNYVLLETGQPLHAFDYDKLKENRIVVRRARAGETLKTIDQETRTLTDDMLIIADATDPVAVAGVMGGFDSEVDDNTKNLLIESAYFDPASVRKTARALRLITEASQRFLRGADPDMTVHAANRVCKLIQEIAGGEHAAGVLDEYPEPVTRPQVTLRFDRSQSLLGTRVAPEEQSNILSGLGFEITSSNETQLTVKVPSWRSDVSHEADLIEEIARLHGFENIPATLPKVRPAKRVFAPEFAKLRAFREHLAALGLSEVVNWTFSSPEEVTTAALEPIYRDMVAISNPLSEKQATMRRSLLPGLLATTSNGLRKSYKRLGLFELGPAYQPSAEELPTQSTHLVIALSGTALAQHWGEQTRPLDIYDIKGWAETVLEYFGAPLRFEEASISPYVEGQCVAVLLGKNVKGHLGLIRQDVLEALEIEQPVYCLDMHIDPFIALEQHTPQFQAMPQYPPSTRDMAVVVDCTVEAGRIRDTALDAGGKILRSVQLFDIYDGEQVPEGKKSVALNLVFQSPERTLRDKDTQKACDKVLKKLAKEFGAELR